MSYNYDQKQSCLSCRYVNYNGQVCGCLTSPYYDKKVSEKQWCRYWGPKMHNPPLW